MPLNHSSSEVRGPNSRSRAGIAVLNFKDDIPTEGVDGSWACQNPLRVTMAIRDDRISCKGFHASPCSHHCPAIGSKRQQGERCRKARVHAAASFAADRQPYGAPWESLQYYPLRDFWRDGKQMISA